MFLTCLHKQGLGYSALNTAKSAISSVVNLVSDVNIGNHRLVKQFMKGVFNHRPTLPRNSCTWDVSKVLCFLSSLHPLSELSFKMLTYKLVVLLALTTGQRVQTLELIDVRNIEITMDYVKIRIGDVLKQTKVGNHLSELYIESFNHDIKICVVRTFIEFL